MPTTQRRDQSALNHRWQPGLIKRLIDQPSGFNFFQAVRLLELWLRRGAPAHGKTLESVLRFKNSVSLRFPPSQIEAVEVTIDANDANEANHATEAGMPDAPHLRRVSLTPAFIGLLGVSGVLPYDYTATIAAQIGLEKNQAGRAFFDSFSHRSVLLFYRAWARSRIECRDDADGRGSFLDIQLALAGRPRQRAPGTAGTAVMSTAIFPDEVVARYAALIRHRPLQADMLTGVLSEYFAVPFHCQPLVGAWASLGAHRTKLGVSSHVLGFGSILGPRYWRRDAIVRLWIGPLTRADFDRFLAGGSAGKALRHMLSLFALPTVTFEIRPMLRAADVRPAALDGQTRLGRAAILHTRALKADHDGTGYHITFSME